MWIKALKEINGGGSDADNIENLYSYRNAAGTDTITITSSVLKNHKKLVLSIAQLNVTDIYPSGSSTNIERITKAPAYIAQAVIGTTQAINVYVVNVINTSSDVVLVFKSRNTSTPAKVYDMIVTGI